MKLTYTDNAHTNKNPGSLPQGSTEGPLPSPSPPTALTGNQPSRQTISLILTAHYSKLIVDCDKLHPCPAVLHHLRRSDGSGKTTQLRRLATHLESEATRSHPPPARRHRPRRPHPQRPPRLPLRSLCRRHRTTTEMSLMFADRAQAIPRSSSPRSMRQHRPLRPLHRSSEAYQAAAANSQRAHPRHHRAPCDNLQPDLTISSCRISKPLLKRLPPQPAHTSSKAPTRTAFERESDDFYRRIYQKYEEIAPANLIAVHTDSRRSID